MVKELLVKSDNPKELDTMLQANFASALVMDGSSGYVQEDGNYVIRCFGDPGFLEFALMSQGYARVIAVRDI